MTIEQPNSQSTVQPMGSLTISRAILAVGAVLLAILAFTTYEQGRLIEAVKIGGDGYHDIVEGKDFVADIVPPALFPMQAFIYANILHNEPERIKTFKPLIAAQHKDFDTRLAYWEKTFATSRMLSGETSRKMLDQFTTIGTKFWKDLKLPSCQPSNATIQQQSMNP